MEQQPIAIEAIYALTTPAFIGGMEPRRADFRIPSFKGALRFWWRACVAARTSHVDELRQREAELFGSARLGRSRLAIASEADPPRLLQVGSELRPSAQQGGSRHGPAHGALYLAYGVVKQGKGTLDRQAMDPPWQVRLRMHLATFAQRTDPSMPFDVDAACAELEHALIALGLFGGLGSKSRKGYGSMVLRALTINGEPRWQPPTTTDELRARILDLYRTCGVRRGGAEPEWTALSGHARHLLVTPAGSMPAFELLDAVGRELVRYRSWGKDGKIFDNETAKRKFPRDHELAKGKLDDCHPERVAFGLPHKYTRDGFSVDPVDKKVADRRASPLVIHVHECAGMPVAVLSFFPARFLPERHERVLMRWTEPAKEKKIPLLPRPELWKPIHTFLDQMKHTSLQTMEVDIP